MWKYLKYFVPLILFAVTGIAAYYIGTEDDIETNNWVSSSLFVPPILGAYWYLYFTKKEYKYAIAIGIAILFTLLPFLVRLLNLFETDLFANYFWGKRIWLWHFTLGSTFISGFYVLRFYQKPKQDAFSTIKLLLVLLASILLLVNMVFIEDEKIIMYSFFTIVGLIIVLFLVHITDMILWEKGKEKNQEDLHSLDNLIDEISGE